MKSRTRGSGSIYKRGAIYWIAYSGPEGELRESTRQGSKGRAQAILEHKISGMRSGEYSPVQDAITMGYLMQAVFADYRANGRKTREDAKRRWTTHLQPVFENLRAARVTTATIREYVGKRLDESAAPATINRELALIMRAFTLGRESGQVRQSPKIAKLREDNVRTGFITQAEADVLAAECAKRGLWMRALFAVLWDTGFRVGEALALKVEQVDLAAKLIRLNPGETKNDRGRVAPLQPDTFVLIQALCAGRAKDALLFTREDGTAVQDFRVTWKTVTEAAGVAGLHVHDLRRSAVREMVRAGVSESVAMKISGHRTRSVFDRYNIVSEADILDAAAKRAARSISERKCTDAVQLPEAERLSH